MKLVLCKNQNLIVYQHLKRLDWKYEILNYAVMPGGEQELV